MSKYDPHDGYTKLIEEDRLYTFGYVDYLEQQNKKMFEALTQVNELIKYSGNYESVKYICNNVYNAIVGKKNKKK